MIRPISAKAKLGVDSAATISNPATRAPRIRISLKRGSLIAQLDALSQSQAVVRARLAAGPSAVGRALGVARAFVAEAGLGRDEAERLAIIVEEWIANLVEHGELPPGSRVGLRLAQANGLVRVTVTDSGAAFDPRTATFEGPNPDRGGGAGLELMRAWSRIAAYGRRAGRNRLVLEMPLK